MDGHRPRSWELSQGVTANLVKKKSEKCGRSQRKLETHANTSRLRKSEQRCEESASVRRYSLYTNHRLKVPLYKLIQPHKPGSINRTYTYTFSDSTRWISSRGYTLESSDFEFEKMEKNNADMDATCKFITNLEKEFFLF